MAENYATACPVEVEPIDGLDAYTVRITGQLLDALGEESVFHLSRIIAIAVLAAVVYPDADTGTLSLWLCDEHLRDLPASERSTDA